MAGQKRQRSKESHSRSPSKCARRPRNEIILRQWSEEYTKRRPIGLHNPRVHCYRNTALQTLFNLPHWAQEILEHDMNCPVDQCLECGLRNLCRAYWFTDRESKRWWVPIDPDRESNTVPQPLRDDLAIFWQLCADKQWKEADEMERQQDADDFIEWILRDMFSTTSNFPFLDDTFSMTTVDHLTCNHCDEIANRQNDREHVLRVVVPEKGGELVDMIHAVMTDKTLPKRTCTRCGEVSDDIHYAASIKDAPEILLVQLGRFKGVQAKSGKVSIRKNNEWVVVLEELDLSQYLIQEAKDNNETLHYQLVSTINHKGSLMSGHYTNFVKGPDGLWYNIDNAYAEQQELETLFDKLGPSNPYILTYVRVDPDEIEREKAEQERVEQERLERERLEKENAEREEAVKAAAAAAQAAAAKDKAENDKAKTKGGKKRGKKTPKAPGSAEELWDAEFENKADHNDFHTQMKVQVDGRYLGQLGGVLKKGSLENMNDVKLDNKLDLDLKIAITLKGRQYEATLNGALEPVEKVKKKTGRPKKQAKTPSDEPKPKNPPGRPKKDKNKTVLSNERNPGKVTKKKEK